MEKRQIAEEMDTLLRQLVMQNQLVMAARVLEVYFQRLWKIDEELANRYVRAYFIKYNPKQLERHLKRLNRAI
ncbi:hypothetical protein [Paenibacillus chungangensis]|uniref:Uncharacterized protein n=1 Tax=Paenibacillus chungangensis TaxID=696535 RepID=A0ABW3HKD6_9BACL